MFLIASVSLSVCQHYCTKQTWCIIVKPGGRLAYDRNGVIQLNQNSERVKRCTWLLWRTYGLFKVFQQRPANTQNKCMLKSPILSCWSMSIHLRLSSPVECWVFVLPLQLYVCFAECLQCSCVWILSISCVPSLPVKLVTQIHWLFSSQLGLSCASAAKAYLRGGCSLKKMKNKIRSAQVGFECKICDSKTGQWVDFMFVAVC